MQAVRNSWKWRLIDSGQRAALRLGLDVRRAEPETSLGCFITHLMRLQHVDVALDVGANRGQYAALLRRHGYAGRIVSFEPLSALHAYLVERAAVDPRWQIASRMALGESEQAEVELKVAENFVASSLLEANADHLHAAPASRAVGVERVPLCRLDRVANGLVTPSDRVLLKLDVQGFELPVLRGATALLPRVRVLQLEASLVPLYRGEPSFDELDAYAQSQGFVRWGLFPGLVDEDSGRMLQIDCVYTRA